MRLQKEILNHVYKTKDKILFEIEENRDGLQVRENSTKRQQKWNKQKRRWALGCVVTTQSNTLSQEYLGYGGKRDGKRLKDVARS